MPPATARMAAVRRGRLEMPEDELRKFAKDMKWERKLDELG